jgi:hypothetical protein
VRNIPKVGVSASRAVAGELDDLGARLLVASDQPLVLSPFLPVDALPQARRHR